MVLQFILGVCCGYLTTSVCESLFHRIIQHASPGQRRAYENFGLIGRNIIRAWFSHHVVHHHLTYRDSHTRQFNCERDKARLDDNLNRTGKHRVIETDYGLRIGGKSSYFAEFVAPTAPFVLAICYFGGPWFAAGALIPFVLWPLLSQCVHPYLHQSASQVKSSAPVALRFLARTGCFQYLARYHWMHHTYTDCNYNLLIGGDFVLGTYRRPSAEDLRAMEGEGLAMPMRRRPRAGLGNS